MSEIMIKKVVFKKAGPLGLQLRSHARTGGVELIGLTAGSQAAKHRAFVADQSDLASGVTCGDLLFSVNGAKVMTDPG